MQLRQGVVVDNRQNVSLANHRHEWADGRWLLGVVLDPIAKMLLWDRVLGPICGSLYGW